MRGGSKPTGWPHAIRWAGVGRHLWALVQTLNEPVILTGALLTTSAIIAFTKIADQLRDPSTLSWDTRILLFLRDSSPVHGPLGPRWLVRIAPDFSALGSPVVLAVLAYGVAGYLLVVRRVRPALALIAAITGGGVLSLWLKDVFARERPPASLHLVPAEMHSFPSGHSLLSAVIYMTVGTVVSRVTPGILGKVYALAAAMLLALLVGVSRVYLGVHYPTDVLGGWAVGLAWGLVCCLVGRRVGTDTGLRAGCPD